MQYVDCLIIGSGLAGLTSAIELAEKGVSVALLSADKEDAHSNSYYAQGGIVYKGVLDSPERLAEDILVAGAGLSCPSTTHLVATLGPELVEKLLINKYQIPFDTHAGTLSLTEEAAHSCPRIIHCKDCTGEGIMQSLSAYAKNLKNLTWYKGRCAVDLITLSHHSKTMTDIYKPLTCVGAYVLDVEHLTVEIFFAKETILATGGVGEVFLHTSNPKSSRGDGLAMAYRAGARIMNMEYVQFHPTTVYYPGERRKLISEALRGEGARILSSTHLPFLDRYHAKAELAPRDVVARGMYQEMVATDSHHLWLDISFKNSSYVKDRFPSAYQYCLSKGYDLTKQPIPVVPAAHYSCGGIAVDHAGRTSIQRLYAIGEVACTGLHGANRLASTSLLEALVFGKLSAESICASLLTAKYDFPEVNPWVMAEEKVDAALIQQDFMTIKQTMWNYVGLIRDQHRLSRAVKMLQELKAHVESFYESGQLTEELLGLRNAVQTALLITQGAMRNKQSLGCHFRIS
jgi:L-aspartate oxidase